MIEPNEKQRKLINYTEGLYLVDAGAGTGKTYTITKRYANLLQKTNIEPKDILLITFTENAADEMKKKVMNQTDYNPAKLREAPISTFHSLCKRILDNHGFSSPQLLGINDSVTTTTRLLENKVQEIREFRNFYYNFIDNNPEYNNFYRIIRNPQNLLDLIKSLSSKGIFPKESGWYRDGEKYLNGDLEEFKKVFKEMNTPRNDGSKQSKLRSKLGGYNKNKCYLENAPSREEIRGGYGSKKIDPQYADRAFNEDRTQLKQFVHDLYHEYIKYALNRNYLNFQFLMMFAYVLLCEDHSLRQKLNYEYVMVDEFQDTNEIQFKLSMLLSKKDNLVVVGDWKQSIYKFQYASVENIKKFRHRIKKYKEELNQNHQRINYQVQNINKIDLTKNYRSTQQILNFSEQSLTLTATKKEELDKQKIKNNIISLESSREETTNVKTNIEAFQSEEEIDTILTKIQQIINNKEYKIETEENGNTKLKTPNYGDIAILSRTGNFGLDLQKRAREYNIPVAFESGVELFKTDPAKLLLAWLRIIENKHSKRGWSVILEKNEYKMDTIKHIIKNNDYPKNILEFRSQLKNRGIATIARKVFNKYGIENGFTDKIIEVLQNTFKKTYINMGEIIQFIIDNMRSEETYEVDNDYGKGVVKIQTIHAAKGLEYPIVFIVDINQARFPNTNTDTKNIQYKDSLGLRQRKIYSEDPDPYPYNNWRSEILFKCFQNYDEERRLMYVAMTRAQDHLILTSDKNRPSQFFKDLNIQTKELEQELTSTTRKTKKSKKTLDIKNPNKKAPIKKSVHSIIKNIEEIKKDKETIQERRRGPEYGKKVHNFAEKYIKNNNLKPRNEDEENIKQLINELQGKLITEKPCILPIKAKDRKITLKGIIDLICVTGNEVKIIDYKTDRTKKMKKEYRKQLSVYYHVTENVFKNKKASAHIYYTKNQELTKIKPLKLKKIKEIVKQSQKK